MGVKEFYVEAAALGRPVERSSTPFPYSVIPTGALRLASSIAMRSGRTCFLLQVA